VSNDRYPRELYILAKPPVDISYGNYLDNFNDARICKYLPFDRSLSGTSGAFTDPATKLETHVMSL
jgi:hypothetical protein